LLRHLYTTSELQNVNRKICKNYMSKILWVVYIGNILASCWQNVIKKEKEKFVVWYMSNNQEHDRLTDVQMYIYQAKERKDVTFFPFPVVWMTWKPYLWHIAFNQGITHILWQFPVVSFFCCKHQNMLWYYWRIAQDSH
jgi:hypothetical protein